MFLIFVTPSAIFHVITNHAKVLKATSGISVKQSLIIIEKKKILAIMDEVNNMLDFKFGQYIKYEDIPPTHKKNILRSFIVIKQQNYSRLCVICYHLITSGLTF